MSSRQAIWDGRRWPRLAAAESTQSMYVLDRALGRPGALNLSGFMCESVWNWETITSPTYRPLCLTSFPAGKAGRQAALRAAANADS